jgi:hypothetical protein
VKALPALVQVGGSEGAARKGVILDTRLEQVFDRAGTTSFRHALTAAELCQHLALGMRVLEQQVVADARANRMSWAAIGKVYGPTRQGAQQRFS